MQPRLGRFLAYAGVMAVAGCATTYDSQPPPLTAAEGRALVTQLLPESVADRSGWATDIYAAIAALSIPPSGENICAAIAVTEQESSFRVDPPVPGLSKIAWTEIDKRRERAGIPKFMVDAALALPSTNGKSYAERLDNARTELQLSEIYDDLIGRVPFGKTFFAERNPVRTGGPMQVSIAFAETHAAAKPYPYPRKGTIRDEVFTRRGGVYFGVAHLLDYSAPYDRHIYRFADFNAGHYASRNAAFQNAVTQVSGVPLALDGDLLRYDGDRAREEPGSTERALQVLAKRLKMSNEDIRHDLELGKSARFEDTRLYTRVFSLADRSASKPVPRAALPKIQLQSPKITRSLTTDWFANRVDGRYRSCLTRYAKAASADRPPVRVAEIPASPRYRYVPRPFPDGECRDAGLACDAGAPDRSFAPERYEYARPMRMEEYPVRAAPRFDPGDLVPPDIEYAEPARVARGYMSPPFTRR